MSRCCTRSVDLRPLVLLPLFLLAGCGYHTAGHNLTLPENAKTLAIPAFLNQSRADTHGGGGA
jgi:hypothetical protein